MCKPDLVQFVCYGTDDGLVSEVEMEPLKIHLPVNPLITMCLSKRETERTRETVSSRDRKMAGHTKEVEYHFRI